MSHVSWLYRLVFRGERVGYCWINVRDLMLATSADALRIAPQHLPVRVRGEVRGCWFLGIKLGITITIHTCIAYQGDGGWSRNKSAVLEEYLVSKVQGTIMCTNGQVGMVDALYLYLGLAGLGQGNGIKNYSKCRQTQQSCQSTTSQATSDKPIFTMLKKSPRFSQVYLEEYC